MRWYTKAGLGLASLVGLGVYALYKAATKDDLPPMSKEEKAWRDAEAAYSQHEMDQDADAYYEDPDYDHSQYM